MNHGALVGWEFAKGGGEFGAKGSFVGIARRGERGEMLHAKLLVMFGACAASPHQVNGGVMREPKEESAFVAGGDRASPVGVRA